MKNNKKENLISEANIVFRKLNLENQEKILTFLKLMESESYSDCKKRENKNIEDNILQSWNSK